MPKRSKTFVKWLWVQPKLYFTMFLYSKLLDVDNLVFNLSFSRWTRKGFLIFQNDLTSIELIFHWITNLVEHDAFVSQISNSIKFIYSIISTLLSESNWKWCLYSRMEGKETHRVCLKKRKNCCDLLPLIFLPWPPPGRWPGFPGIATLTAWRPGYFPILFEKPIENHRNTPKNV